MTAASRSARFKKQAQKPAGNTQSENGLPIDTVHALKRLSGFCLAPAGSHAVCLDADPAIQNAMEKMRPALRWQDASKSGPLDLVVATGALQQRLSDANGQWHAVRDFLSEWSERLAPGGRLILRENAILGPEQMVLLELPDYKRKVGAKNDASRFTAKRLFEYASHARPLLPEEFRGFFVEEVAPTRRETRLFRLPLKWAAEFTARMNLSEDAFAGAMGREFFLGDESVFRRQILYQLGLRVVVSAPHWDSRNAGDWNAFRLYSDDDSQKPMPPPASEITYVLEKPAARDGLWVNEQRMSGAQPNHLSLVGMRHDKTGDDYTLITGLTPGAQILAWRHLPNDRLGVWLYQDRSEPLANVLPRKTHRIDGRRFSSHMAAPLSLDLEDWTTLKDKGHKAIGQWLQAETGLRLARVGEPVQEGKLSFPAPDFIDQAITTIFIETDAAPANVNGTIACFDAEDVLQSIHAGLLPAASLEAQLWQLARHAGVALQPLTDRKVDLPIDEEAGDKIKVTSYEALCRKLMPDENKRKAKPFKHIRGHAGDWRVVRSVFVDQTMDGPTQAREQEFVLNEDAPLHRAALLCVSRSLDGEALAGFDLVECPVPSRYGKPGEMLRLPTLPLPGDLRSIPEARVYIAEQLDIKPENVVPCGEAVFTHVGVTPQKIFPFLITRAPLQKKPKLLYAPLSDIKKIIELDNTDSFLWYWGLAFAFLGEGSDFSLGNAWENRAKSTARRMVTASTLRAVGS